MYTMLHESPKNLPPATGERMETAGGSSERQAWSCVAQSGVSEMQRVVMVWAVLAVLAACASPGGQPAGGAAAARTGAAPAAAGGAPAPEAAVPRPPLQPLRIGIPLPSLSYLPAWVASKRGFFEEAGLAAEFPLVTGNAIMP